MLDQQTMNKMVQDMYSKMMKGNEPMAESQMYQQNKNFGAFAGFFGKNVTSAYPWIIDSGATSNMCSK